MNDLQKQLHAIADQIDYGHLLLSTDGGNFLDTVAATLADLRSERDELRGLLEIHRKRASDAEAASDQASAEIESMRSVLRELDMMRQNFNAGWDRIAPR